MRKNKKFVISITTALFLVGAGSYTYETVQHDQIQNVSASTTQKEQPSLEKAEELTKEEIQNRMLNSIDNFESVKGSFLYYSQGAGHKYKVNYKVRMKNKPSSYEKVITDNKYTKELAFNGETETFIDHKHRVYRSNGVQKQKWDKEKYKSPKDRYGTKNGKPLYITRYDPTFMGGLSQTSVFPQDIALGFLEDYGQWEIASQQKMKDLNLDVVILEGQLNNYYQQKYNATKFKLWVHKKTGILVQFEVYDENNNVPLYLKTTSIKINDSSSKNDSNYKLDKPSDYKNFEEYMKEKQKEKDNTK